MKTLLILVSLFTYTIQITPPHFCDDTSTYTDLACQYFSSATSTNAATTADPCLVYKDVNYCIRCMINTYLTPTKSGQYCSYITNPISGETTVADGQSCTLSYYNSQNGAPTGSYITANKVNSTDGSAVIYCLDQAQVVKNSLYCYQYTQSKTGDAYTNWALQSIGCFQCTYSLTYGVIQPIVSYNTQLGVIVNDCTTSSLSNYSQICPMLSIYDTSSASCVQCNSKIEQCLQCSDLMTCTVCQAGYRPVKMIDSAGTTYTGCLWDFCGYDQTYYKGLTNDCFSCNSLQRCLQCKVYQGLTSTTSYHQSCMKCQPGYYQVETVVNSVSIYTCSAQIVASIKVDLFVFEQDDGLYTASTGDGQTFQNAYKFLAQAINDVYTGISVDVTKYQNITANIWIGKGTHYWFFCPESATGNTITTVCENPNMQYSYPKTNNVNLTVRAMDCEQQKYYFKNLQSFGSYTEFVENCVSTGTKPQIRVASNHTFFNVTFQANFINLEFSGVDMLVVDQSNSDECDYSFIPAKKCDFESQQSSVVKQLQISEISSFGCDYRCEVDGYLNYYDRYEPLTLQSYNRSNIDCLANTTGIGGTTMCSGLPYNDDYFKESSGVFYKRHTVLFNLYSFDGLSSKSIITPTLNIFNCDFTYFLSNTESLINIETDNIVYGAGGDNINTGTIQDKVFFYYGVDSGAVISIANSTFNNSKFCKGLIVYRRQQAFTFNDSPRLVNMTQLGKKYPTQSPNLTITDSVFQNLGFTDVLRRVTVPNMIDTEGFIVKSILQYNAFTNKGMVLNMKYWRGSVTIQDSIFLENMYNIPGLAYVQYASDQVDFSKSSVKDEKKYYQNSQLYCLGSLLPKLSADIDLYGFTESFNLIHLTNMTGQTVTIQNSTFESNIGFDGNIFIDNVDKLVVQKSKFKENMSYTQSNAINIRFVNQTIIEDSLFLRNQGWYLSKGGATSITNSKQALILDNTFDSNLAGTQGSALYLIQNQQMQIQNNSFTANGPSFSVNEQNWQTPYYYYLLNQLRPSVYYDPLANCSNEFAYLQKCASPTTKIKMSYMEGAIYIYTQSSKSKLISAVTISSNSFFNNQAAPILDSTQQIQSQSSCITIKGQTMSTIKNNKFRSQKSNFNVIIRHDAPQIYNSVNNITYWQYSNAPLMKLQTISASIIDNLFTDNMNWQANMLGSLIQFKSILQTNLTAKIFSANTSIPIKIKQYQQDSLYNQSQVWSNLTVNGSNTSQSYKNESTLELEYESMFISKIVFKNNLVQENTFNSMNDDDTGGMIQVQNSFAIIFNNTITSNGNFDYGKPVISVQDGAALIEQNVFKQLYCQKQCIAELINAQSQIQNNTIEYIVGGALRLKQSNLVFQDQKLNNTFNSIIIAVDSTIQIYRCTFLNSQGDQGAVLRLDNTTFIMAYSTFYQSTQVINKSQSIQSTYQGTRPLKFFISDLSLINLNSIENAYGLIFVTNSLTKSTILDCQFNQIVGDYASILMLQNSNVSVIQSYQENDFQIAQSRRLQSYNQSHSYMYNQASNGSLFVIQNSELTLLNITLINSKVQNSIINADASDILIQDSEISQNNVGSYGSLQLSFCSNITIVNSSITHNTGDLIVKAVSSVLYVQNLNLSFNYAQEVTISATSSQLFFNNTLFQGNQAILVSNGFQLISSDLQIRNSIIQNSAVTAPMQGFFQMMVQSSLSILDNTIIRNITGQNQGLLFSMGDLSITIANNVTITNCSSSSYTPIIVVLRCQNFTVLNSSLFGILPSFMQAFQTKVYILNSQFTNFGKMGSILIATQSNILMTNVTMHDSGDQNTDGNGLLCNSCQNVTINNCTFYNLVSNNGGALKLQAKSILLTDNVFKNNIANKGGALYTDQSGPTTISNSTFVNNTANIDGGAILYDCKNNTLKCQINLEQDLFIQNSAKVKGGALQYYGSNFTYINSTFINNTATYCNDLGSFPNQLILSSPDRSFYYDSNSLLVRTQGFPLIPGHKNVINIWIYDQEGRLYQSENKAVAKLSFQDQSQGYYITGKDAVAENGVFKFDNLRFQMQITTNAVIQLKIENLDNYQNNITFITQNIQLKVSSLNCLQGEHFTDLFQCISCDAGYYLLDQSNQDSLCLVCKQEAQCFGGSYIVPRPGYYRLSLQSDQFIKCIQPESCLGGNINEPMTVCKEGYGGILCSICQHNWFRTGYYKCAQCYDVGLEVFFYCINLTVLIVTICLLQRSQLAHLSVTQPRMFVYYKIMITHIQIMGFLSQINFYWGQNNSNLLYIWEVISRVPLTAIAPACLIQQLGNYSNAQGSTNRLLYLNIIMTSCIPYISLFIIAVFWLSYSILKNQMKEVKDYIFATNVIVIYIYQPVIMEFMFKAINCQNFIGDGFRVAEDLHEVGYKQTHLIYLLVLAIPTIILWLFLGPFWINHQLNQNAALLNQIKLGEISRFEQQLIRTFRLRLSFVTAGFKTTEYNWQLLSDYKRIMVIFFIVFAQTTMQSSQEVSLLILLFLLICMAAQLYIKPYYCKELNQMEGLCLFLQIQTVFTGLFFSDQKEQQNLAIQNLAFCFLLLSNVFLVVVYYLRLRVEILIWIIENEWNGRCVKFIRTLLFGCVNVQQFRKQYMARGTKNDEFKVESFKQVGSGETLKNLQGFEAQFNSEQSNEISISNLTEDKHVDTTIVSNRTAQVNSGRKFQSRMIEDDEKVQRQVSQALELLPIEQNTESKLINTNLKKPAAKQVPQKLNFNLNLGAKHTRHQNQSIEVTDSDDDATQRTDNLLKDSYTASMATDNQFFKDSQSKVSVEQQKQLSHREVKSPVSHRSGSSTFRQQQNFNYKDELEFKNEEIKQQYPRKGKQRKESSSDDMADEDPFGMLSKRSRFKRQQKQRQNQRIKVKSQHQPASVFSVEKDQFENTFGGDRDKPKLKSPAYSSSSSSSQSVSEQQSQIKGESKKQMQSNTQVATTQQSNSQHQHSKGQGNNQKIAIYHSSLADENLVPRESVQIDQKSSQSSVESNSDFQQSARVARPIQPQRIARPQQKSQSPPSRHQGARNNNLIQSVSIPQLQRQLGGTLGTTLHVSDIESNMTGHQLHFSSGEEESRH